LLTTENNKSVESLSLTLICYTHKIKSLSFTVVLGKNAKLTYI